MPSLHLYEPQASGPLWRPRWHASRNGRRPQISRTSGAGAPPQSLPGPLEALGDTNSTPSDLLVSADSFIARDVCLTAERGERTEFGSPGTPSLLGRAASLESGMRDAYVGWLAFVARPPISIRRYAIGRRSCAALGWRDAMAPIVPARAGTPRSTPARTVHGTRSGKSVA